ncbi:SPT2 chromatin protein-domain-containing protein [Phycomyces blakesleeanus]
MKEPKVDAREISFEQLMLQATQVAKEQNAVLAEKALEKKREKELQARREEEAERARKETLAVLAQQRNEQARRQQRMLDEKQQRREELRQAKPRRPADRIPPSSSTSERETMSRGKTKSNPSKIIAPEKKKHAEISFEQLMEKAKEMTSKPKDNFRQQMTSSEGPAVASKRLPSKMSLGTTKGPKSSVDLSGPLGGGGGGGGSRVPRQKDIGSGRSIGQTTGTNRPPASRPRSRSRDENTASSIYVHKAGPQKSSTVRPKLATEGRPVSAREKAVAGCVPQKVERQQRDRRTISEVQRERRHARGHYSDEEIRVNKRPVPPSSASSSSFTGARSLQAGKRAGVPLPRGIQRSRDTSPPDPRRARPHPASSSLAANGPRSSIQSSGRPRVRSPDDDRRPRQSMQDRPMMNRRDLPPMPGRPRPSQEPGIRRMPFRPMERRPVRRPRPIDEEQDDDLDSFIVDDDEEDNRDYYGADVSSEISRIFRYDKSKYDNDFYSDDDMEADASEVLREEKRSARIGRKEDLREEKLELERVKKRKGGGGGGGGDPSPERKGSRPVRRDGSPDPKKRKAEKDPKMMGQSKAKKASREKDYA